MLLQGQIGPSPGSDNAQPYLRLGRQGEAIIQELHGRFYEQCLRGNLFSAGSGVTALSANSIGLTASGTPIVGVWNPPGSGKNLVILQASLGSYVNTLSAPVSAGAFVWAGSIGNIAVSTGAAPFNRLTMQSGGSVARAFNGGVALTGLTNNLVVIEGADFAPPGPLTYGTITAPTASGNALAGSSGVQNFDGHLFVPPGGVLALLNTTSTTTMSVVSRLIWEEVIIAG